MVSFLNKRIHLCVYLHLGTQQGNPHKAHVCCADQWMQRGTGRWWHHAKLCGFQRRAGPGQQQDRLDAQNGLGTVGLWIAGQEGKAINTSLPCLGGSQLKHSCHEGEMLSTLTVIQEDVKQKLHKANVKNSTVWLSCISKLKTKKKKSKKKLFLKIQTVNTGIQ